MFSNEFGSHKNVECGLCCIIKRKPEEVEQESKGPIPLVSVSAFASVVHSVAQVEITQVYVNKEEQPIEAIYYFPVDSNGAVTHFHAEIEGRTIKGVVKAHEEAKEQYEKAIEQKQTAFLGSENKPDIFQVRIGFLKPGTEAKIVIGYVTEVKNEKGSNAMRFFLPTTVAPRYIPPTETDPKGQDLANMKFSEQSPAPMSIKVNVAMQGEIKSVESPTHKVEVTEKGPVPEKTSWNRAVVELNGKTTDMDRDFVLLVTPAETHKPRLYTEKLADSNSLTAMTHFIPSFKLDEQNAELIFLLDRSGSMQGLSMDLSKQALLMFLHSMPMDCYFNIVGFGSHFEFLFPESVKYDDKTLKTALEHAKKLDANMGGTEVLEPLKEIYKKPTIPGYLRQIFLLTDGEVSNTEQVIGLTKVNAHNNRLFALGIGDGASHHLVEGIANAGGGTSSFVTYNEKIDSKVLQQLKNAIQPSLTDITVTWKGVTPEKESPTVVNTEKTLLGYGKPVEEGSNIAEPPLTYKQAPRKVPPIFDGSQMVLLGVFKNEMPTGVSITALTPDGPLSMEIPLTEENDIGSTGMLHKLAGIKIVRELELEVSALGYSSSETEAQESSLKKQIIEIACENGIASKYTSFVAVDDSNKKSEDNWVMQSRYVPSQYAHGWHGGMRMQAAGAPMMPMMMCSMPAMSGPPPNSFSALGFNASFGCSNYSAPAMKMCKRSARAAPMVGTLCDMSSDGGFGGTEMETESLEVKEPEITDPLHAIVSLQSFVGSYTLDDAFCKAISKDLDKLKKEATTNKWDENAWATVLALTHFTLNLSDRKDSWELIYNKAKKWLSKNHPNEMDAMFAAAEKIIKKS